MNRFRCIVPLVALSSLVGVGVAQPGASANAIEKHKGVDSCANESTSRMQTLYSGSSYGTYGFYIGGSTVNNACPTTAAFHNNAWVSTVVGQGWDLLPIYSDRQPSCGGVSVSFPISTNVTTAYSQGVAAANGAISAAYTRGMFGPVVLDVEPDIPNGASCAAAVDQYVKGFVDQVHTNPSYIPTLYSGYAITIRSASLSAPAQVIVPHWNGVLGVYSGLPNLPSGWWIYDQRGHQYSGPVTETYGGNSFVFDRNCFDLTVFGNTVHSTYASCLA